ncbi:unnamed protein product, partial [Meganyctiphanes norvegica]
MAKLRVVMWRCVLVVLVVEVGSSTSHSYGDSVKNIALPWLKQDQDNPVTLEEQVSIQQHLLGSYNSEGSNDIASDSNDAVATVSWRSWSAGSSRGSIPGDPLSRRRSYGPSIESSTTLGLSGGGSSGAQHQCDRQQIEDMRQDQEMFVEPGGYPQGDYDYKKENITIGLLSSFKYN